MILDTALDFYVRSRLRLERNKLAQIWKSPIAHALFAIYVIVLIWQHLLPFILLVTVGILLVYNGVGLSSLRKARPPRVIGFQEMGYGFTFVILVAVGFWIGG